MKDKRERQYRKGRREERGWKCDKNGEELKKNEN